MPVSMTFNSLKTSLQAYLERSSVADDPTFHAQIPSLINQAERDIATALKISDFINVLTTTLLTGQSVYEKPGRWKDTVSMNFGVGSSQVRTPLFPRSYEYCRRYWPDEELTEQPEFYADYDRDHWLIVPTPDADYPMEVIVYQLLPLLDNTNQTNWLTDYAPNALLYGTLLQAAPFIKDDSRIPVWEKFYTRELSLLNGEDLQRIIDRSTARQET